MSTHKSDIELKKKLLQVSINDGTEIDIDTDDELDCQDTFNINNDEAVNEIVTSKTSTFDQKKIKQEKFSSDQWENMETSADSHLRQVLDVMRLLGTSENTSLQNKAINTCGEDYEVYLRNKLINDKNYPLPFSKLSTHETKSKNKSSKKHGGKQKHRQVTLEEAFEDPNVNSIKEAESYIKSHSQGKIGKNDIGRINTIKILESSYDKILENFNTDNFSDNNGFRNNYIEFRIITLMLCINYAIIHKIAESECFELAIATDRIIVALDEFNISKQLKKDISALNKRFKEVIAFSHRMLCEKYPRMLFPTKFDTIIPTTSIKAYPNQIELIQTIKTQENVLILLQTMIGGGKTTMAGALAVHTQQKRALEKASVGKERTQLLFICSVAPVREQVGKIIWNLGIGLAIATLDSKSGQPKITKNYNCDKKEEKIVAILSDISSGLILLQNMKEDDKKYIVLFDEPTVGADQPNHPITNTIPQFLKHSPEQFILCSATIPNVDQIPQTIQIFKDAHPNAVIKTITSKISYIGCEIVSFDGNTVTPHANCKTVDELKFIIQRINDQPFIGRLYTAPIIYKMHSLMHDIGVNNIPSIDDYFSNVKNHSQSKVQEFAIQLLNSLIETNDNNIIESVCVPINRITINESKPKIDTEKNSDSDDLFSFEDSDEEDSKEEDSQDFIYDVNLLTTSLASKHMGGCLLASNAPIKTGEIMYKSYIDRKIRLKDLLSNYESQKKALSAMLSNIDKKKTSQENHSRDDKSSRDDVVESKDYRSKKKQELEESNNPTFLFPNHLQINTYGHLKQHTKKPLSTFDSETVRNPFTYDDVDFGTSAPSWLPLFLYGGSGVYDPDDLLTDKPYLDNVLRHAENGRLAYLVAGHSIAYGTNFPLSNVIAEDELCDNHSMNTLFQLINRAGRVGRSWVAHAYLGPNTIDRINNYIHGNIGTGTSDEAINMELAVTRMHKIDDMIKCENEKILIENAKKEEQLKKEELYKKNKQLLLTNAKKLEVEKEKENRASIVSLRDLSIEDNRQYPSARQLPQWSRNKQYDRQDDSRYSDSRNNDSRHNNFRNNDRNNDFRNSDSRNNDFRNSNSRNSDSRNSDSRNNDFRNNGTRNNGNYDSHTGSRNNTVSTTQPVSNEDSVITQYKELKKAGKYIPMHIKKNEKVIQYINSLS